MRPSPAWLLVLAVLTSACSTRLPPIGTGGQPFAPAEDERALWAQAQRESEVLLQQVRAYDDPQLSKYLTLMAERLTPEGARAAAGGPAWWVEVLLDPTLSAFAMPDGRVFVHSGLLAAIGSEAQLALVLGRAVAQVTHRHALAASRDGRLGPVEHAGVTPLSATAAAILGRSLPLAAAASITGYGARRDRKADAVALTSLARAGWDTEDAARVWDLLAAEERGPLETFQLGRPAWLRERRESTRRRLDRNGAVAPGAVRTTEEFEALRRPVVRDNAAEDIRHGRFALARRALDRVLAAAPMDALAHSYYGDLHRLQAQQARSPDERSSAARQAEVRYARAIELDPARAEPHRQLGLLHYERGDIARARAELEQYLALAPGAPDARRITEYVQELGR